jgi:D-alanine-D-alanine ligase
MPKARIGIIHNEPVLAGKEFSEASHDVLVQVEAIEKVLMESGYPTARVPFTKNLKGFTQRMSEARVQAAFNLCETVDEDPQLAGHPAAVLELMGVPFTGSPSMALMLTTDKLMSKRLLRAKGMRTPDYLVYESLGSFNPGILTYPVIAKPRYQDASIGIDQGSVFKSKKELLDGIERLYAQFGTLIIEEFVDGREFNVSLIGYPRARVLPIAEIDFEQFPEGLFPIVGYRAKWERSSFEYNHTPRIFPMDLSPGLTATIENTALDCFRLFLLRDYGRIDLRMDKAGRIHVLELNANCCLSPDAGFAAAAERSGSSYSEMVIELLDSVMKRAFKHDHQACTI